MSAARRARLADVGTYLAYVVIFLFFAGPLLWILSLSIRTAAEVYVSDIRLWPRAPTLENYAAALGNPLFLTYLWNGLKLGDRRRPRRDALRHPRRLRAVALPVPPPQPGDDRAARVPDDLAPGHHGAALPLHGPGRA